MDDEETILETRKLTKKFGGLVALSNVDLRLQKGELRAIIGPNGAGKTTLINLITGRLIPSEGKIYFQGKDITRKPSHILLREGIATTFQLTNIFQGFTVFENIAIAAQRRDKHFRHPLINTSNLVDVEEKTKKILKMIGLNEKSNELASNLAHGDQRILEIGIALGTDPILLLLDEPTQGMSLKETTEMAEVIERLSKLKTITLIEHNIDIVMRLAQRITVLDQGQILAEGTADDISRNTNVQEVYLGSG